MVERLRHQYRLALTKVQMEVMSKGSHLCGIRGFGHGHPLPESRLYRLSDWIFHTAFDNLPINCGRNHDFVVNLAQQTKSDSNAR